MQASTAPRSGPISRPLVHRSDVRYRKSFSITTPIMPGVTDIVNRERHLSDVEGDNSLVHAKKYTIYVMLSDISH